jgi:hypothetical protein
MNKAPVRKIETTLGELIAAASEVAFEYSNSDREAYKIAQQALIEILRKTPQPLDMDFDSEDVESFSPRLH